MKTSRVEARRVAGGRAWSLGFVCGSGGEAEDEADSGTTSMSCTHPSGATLPICCTFNQRSRRPNSMTRSPRRRRPTIFAFLLGPARRLAVVDLTTWICPDVANAVPVGPAISASASAAGAKTLKTEKRSLGMGGHGLLWALEYCLGYLTLARSAALVQTLGPETGPFIEGVAIFVNLPSLRVLHDIR
jgi:hypothetical protein